MALIKPVEALGMKTRVFTDDGLPESWDYNDNYHDMDQAEAEVHVLKWKRDTASCHSKPAASLPSITKAPRRGAETGFKTRPESGV